MKQKANKAFTLVEVLIVITIVGVLAGITMISAGSATDKTEETRCLADRRSLRSALNLYRAEHGSYGGFGNDELKDIFDNFHGEFSGGAELNGSVITGVCPSGGKYTISKNADTGNYTITCNKHTPVRSFADAETMKRILDVFKKYGLNNSNTQINLDSETIKTNASNLKDREAFAAALKEAGLDMEALGATSWAYNYNTPGFLYWTPVAVSTIKDGTKTPVIRYNFNTGTYTVWTVDIMNGKLTADNKAYQAYTPSTKDDKVQSYETALKIFQEYK